MSFPTPINLITKAQVKEIAEKHVCQTTYNGEERTMYIYNGEAAKAFEEIHELEGQRYFKVRTKHVRSAIGI
jgi:hypothetical protein